MRVNETVFIIDDNEERCHKLTTIVNFLGEQTVLLNYKNWRNQSFIHVRCILVGYPGANNLIHFLREWQHFFPKLPLILIDGHTDKSLYRAMTTNILANLTFPFTYAQILQAMHKYHIIKQFNELGTQNHLPLFHSLVGKSKSISQIRKLIMQVAKTNTTVLVLGESGTGKEIVARNIHALSLRHKKPFIPINCGAIPAELLESELFGHEKGAFTGAITFRQGRFELADGGTLFLDEIGDMPLPMQVKLLRVLQEHCFERVGSNKSIAVDVRIIAATHRNLEELIKEGTFREDLFYRLNVFPIDIPPLRLRCDDLLPLIHELVSRIEADNKPGIHFMPNALHALRHYQWPGNIRELANLIERLSILFPNGIIDLPDLPCRFKRSVKSSHLASVSDDKEAFLGMLKLETRDGINLKEHLVKTELALISQALAEADWVVTHAAVYLNMRRTTLVEKIRKYGLTRPIRTSH